VGRGEPAKRAIRAMEACGNARREALASQSPTPRAASHRDGEYSALQKLIFRKSGNDRNFFENSI